ncbi:MAG TPA: type II toxin-antitoxin system mRNA interferase toxin, RelE/StbE family [Steroidobacteraceae bacterium]|nr:type II toxin-antitoxin system mRNA interferase toxin, RelE/StbE family [Steroidobacteraceae bacterium]
MTVLRFRKRFLIEIRELRDLRGRTFDLDAWLLAIELLGSGADLPAEFGDHELKDDWAHRRELHIGDDDLVIYVRKRRTDEVVFHRAGTHKRLFRKRTRQKP